MKRIAFGIIYVMAFVSVVLLSYGVAITLMALRKLRN
jgi:hypothetical protein